jgi:hypothetical protein
MSAENRNAEHVQHVRDGHYGVLTTNKLCPSIPVFYIARMRGGGVWGRVFE